VGSGVIASGSRYAASSAEARCMYDDRWGLASCVTVSTPPEPGNYPQNNFQRHVGAAKPGSSC
jgi:hypothetical protein